MKNTLQFPRNFSRLRRITLALLALSLAVCAQAQTFTTLASFDGVNVSSPFDPLIQSTNGNFYATSVAGGAHRVGAVFEVTSQGTVTNLYSFCSLAHCADGSYPYAALILGADGDFYGTTEGGGANGDGTIFKLTPDGKLTTLHSFCSLSSCADGYGTAGLIRASDANFYGTLSNGGANSGGVFFELTSSGTFNVLYNFCSLSHCADGRYPSAPPIQAGNRNFYGTTYYGGRGAGAGVIYEISPAGAYRVLYAFCAQTGCADGGRPNGLAQDASGNLYGTTSHGGGICSNNACGTIFKITPTSQYVVLHTFEGSDGDEPAAGLALANDGNLYGTTWSGSGGGGNIFSVTPEGIFTSLYSFCSEAGCIQPRPNGLFQGTNGVLYGTTQEGAQYNAGEVFSLSNGLRPLVETVPVAGKAGQSVIMLGNGLTGSTSVTFNGVAAAFTVESDTYIKATVPAGATTGKVSVVTPSGTLSSNPQFVVTK